MVTRLQKAGSRLLGRLRSLGDHLGVAATEPRLAADAARHLARRARPLAGGSGPPASAPSGPPSLDALIDHLGRRMGVLVLERAGPAATVGVADLTLLQALEEVASLVPHGALQAGGRRIAPRRPADRVAALSAPSVVLSFLDDAGDLASLALEGYVRLGDGTWLSNNRRNGLARALYGDLLLRPGRHPLSAVVPPSRNAPTPEPIDVVYTWVNHADPGWSAAFRQARASEEPGEGASDGAAATRFHQNGELRYSLRSVALNLPWARHVTVLSNCAPPDWLDVAHPRLSWVDHREVIPAELLPTFSSHVIESFLHRIPGLGDRFVYMNDDFFVARRLPRERFFDARGRSAAALEPWGLVSGPVDPLHPDHVNAARNAAALLLDAFGTYPTRLHAHAPYALNRTLLEEIEARWPAAFATFRTSRFRGPGDLNLTSFLCHHYGLLTDRAWETPPDMALVTHTDVRWRALLRHAETADVQTICVNEGGRQRPGPAWHGAVRGFMERRFPTAAPWER